MARKKIFRETHKSDFPKCKVGETINIDYLGEKRVCVVTAIVKEDPEKEKWVIEATCVNTSRKLSNIGINWSERVCNYIQD